MTRVLFLTRYDDLGASSRYRSFQYLPYLREHGFEIDVSPMLDNGYITRLYSGQPIGKASIIRSYACRIASMLRLHAYDLVWIEKEALPFIPGWLERTLIGRTTQYVVDYDDAVFHNYDRHPNPVVRKLLGNKYDRIMRGAAIVVAGNAYIAERAERAGARRVEILPSVVDLERYDSILDHDSNEVTFGWIGTPVTAKFLERVRPVFSSLGSNSNIRLVTIGSGDLGWNDRRVTARQWTEATEVDELRQLSVGLMPLDDAPFERGKCGLKLIQYMAVGLPVLASPVGVNAHIVEPGINGFLCESEDDWRRNIELLASDPFLRERLGRAGRKKVEAQYSLQVAAPQLSSILEKAAITLPQSRSRRNF